MASWVVTDSMRGQKGDKGDTGSISSASVETVPSHVPASVVMSGTNEVKHAHFKLPRGLDAVGAADDDSAIAAFVLASGTDTRNALTATFPVQRVWNGTAYPPRIAGAVNIFVGTEDPGLVMDPLVDIWANPDETTLADVEAAMRNPASGLYAATRATVTDRQLQMFGSSSSVLGSAFGPASYEVYALSLPSGATNSVRFSGRIPDGWNYATVRAFWVHDTGAGAARFEFNFRVWESGGVSKQYSTTQSYTSAGTMVQNEVTLNNRAVTGGAFVSGTVTRVGGSSLDTIAAPVGVVCVMMERVS